MLQRIEIHHIALIEEAVVEFAPGLNILTGETGAGKSILIDALNLVLGVRADRELIQAGYPKASVEASFVDSSHCCDVLLEELGIEAEDMVTLSREIYATGRNACRINGTLVNNASMQKVSEKLIDIHGQHEHQSLFNALLHIELLDAFGGKPIAEAKASMQGELSALKKCMRELGQYGAEDGERERRLDILSYQFEEIKKARLLPGEDAVLQQKRNLLNNSQRIAEVFSEVEQGIQGESGGLSDTLRGICRDLRSIAPFDDAYQSLANEFDELYFSLENAIDSFQKKQQLLDFDPELAEEIGNRLDEINTLKRKYGASIEAILENADAMEAEIDRLGNAEGRIKALEAEKSGILARLHQRCLLLHEVRTQAAQRFEKSVTKELEDLGMSRVRFAVSFAPIAQKPVDDVQQYHQNGLDHLEFMLSANPGQPLRPLSRIASGGEASRIMLALKNISAQLDGIDCLIFDEIDTGISGNMAHVVAQKMAAISRGRQVLCVTHLAQLACMADTHFLIEKRAEMESTKTTVTHLAEQARSLEIARLLGGTGESGHGLEHAKEMISQANSYKKNTRIKAL